MNAQFYSAEARPFEMAFGQPVAVNRLGGEFSVISGRVWLTRSGDLEDHVLAGGERVQLLPDEQVLIEPFARDEPAVVYFKSRSPARPVAAAAYSAAARGLRLAAGGLRRAGVAFDALARNAACNACRAQGCIDA